MNGSDSAKRRFSRRRLLKVASGVIVGFAAYSVLDYSGLLGSGSPIRSYISGEYRKQLHQESQAYGENGDRVAYAVAYLGLPPSAIIEVIDSWNLLPAETKNFMDDKVATATAVVVADELSHPDTRHYAQAYPNLLWTHAHANALFAFPLLPFVQSPDLRLQKMADLRLSEGPAVINGEKLELYYPENNPEDSTRYGKRKYVREGFKFFAEVFGSQMNKSPFTDLSVMSEQSTAAAVTVQYTGVIGNMRVSSGDTFVFFNTQQVPRYCFSAGDNSEILGPGVSDGSLSIGLATMKNFEVRHPNLNDSCRSPLDEQGYLRSDEAFSADSEFSQYLRHGYFTLNPNERTFAWKEYQTVSLRPEQTVRGLGVAKIADFHPANFQPLSMLMAYPSIVELLVQSPEVYTPSQWHRGLLFRSYDMSKESCETPPTREGVT
jgi:hypothetical protein